MFLPEHEFGNTVNSEIASGVEVLPPEPGMDRLHAERLCQELEFHYQNIVQYYADNIRSRLIQLRDGRGYEALGYTSMKGLCDHRFEKSKSEFYRQLEAGDVEQSIGIPFGTLKTSQAIALKPLQSGDDRRAVLSAVKSSGNPTAAKLKTAVDDRLNSDLPPQSAIFELYAQYGTVTPTPSSRNRNAFQVKRDHPESPDEMYFLGLKAAWERWNDQEFQVKVQDAISRFGDYAETAIPNSCLNCLHRDLKHVGAAEGEVYCNKKQTGIGLERVIEMATTGCYRPENPDLTPEANASAAEMEQTPGARVVVQIDGANHEAIALMVEVKYVNRHGMIAHKKVALRDVLAGLKTEEI